MATDLLNDNSQAETPDESHGFSQQSMNTFAVWWRGSTCRFSFRPRSFQANPTFPIGWSSRFPADG